MAEKKRLSVDIKLNGSLIQEVQRLILATGMLVIFGAVCIKIVDAGLTEQLLPFLAGLMGMIVGYYFASRPKKKPGKKAKSANKLQAEAETAGDFAVANNGNDSSSGSRM